MQQIGGSMYGEYVVTTNMQQCLGDVIWIAISSSAHHSSFILSNSKQSLWCQQHVMWRIPSHITVMFVSYCRTAVADTRVSYLGLSWPPIFNPSVTEQLKTEFLSGSCISYLDRTAQWRINLCNWKKCLEYLIHPDNTLTLVKWHCILVLGVAK